MKFNLLGKFISLLSTAVVLVGCSSTYHSYKETLAYAFNPEADIELSLGQVTKSSMDLLYFRRGEQRQAVLALAFLEDGQYKWISADKALVVMAQGRIVRTEGLENNLLFTTSDQPDPLTFGVHALVGMSWRSVVDWENDEYGYSVNGVFGDITVETLNILGSDFTVIKVVETLNYQAPSNFVRFDQQWENEYWFDSNTAQLLKSKQKYSPFQPAMEFIFISRAARLIQQGHANAPE